jgi:hypothetical protein
LIIFRCLRAESLSGCKFTTAVGSFLVFLHPSSMVFFYHEFGQQAGTRERWRNRLQFLQATPYHHPPYSAPLRFLACF